MATILGNNQVKLNNGQVVQAQTGAWYDGKQYWNGTLSDPGVINAQSNQVGAGQAVSAEVNAQSARQQGVTPQQFESYLQGQRNQPTIPSNIPTGPVGSVGNTGSSMGVGSMGAGFTTPGTINLPEIYQNLYKTSGISEKETEMADYEKKYIEARNKISDNPFLSASLVDSRLARLEGKYEQKVLPLKNEVATKKADIETQLNLQSKQFDINSESAKNALTYFNTLLEAGALTNASGEAIAQITRTTGLPSSVIQSAIQSNQAKNKELFIDTFTADNGEVTVVSMDKKTGEIVSQQSLGRVGNQQNGTAGSSTQSIKARFLEDAKTVKPVEGAGHFAVLVANYAPYLSLEEIYSLYAQSDLGKRYGLPKENPQEVKELYDNYRGY